MKRIIKRIKIFTFKLIFGRQIDLWLDVCNRRENNYFIAREASGQIASSNCRMDFIEMFLADDSYL